MNFSANKLLTDVDNQLTFFVDKRIKNDFMRHAVADVQAMSDTPISTIDTQVKIKSLICNAYIQDNVEKELIIGIIVQLLVPYTFLSTIREKILVRILLYLKLFVIKISIVSNPISIIFILTLLQFIQNFCI